MCLEFYRVIQNRRAPAAKPAANGTNADDTNRHEYRGVTEYFIFETTFRSKN